MSSKELLERLFAEHDEITARWLDYELDVAKVIAFPAMSDGRQPLTAAFLRAKKIADALRPSSATAKVSEQQVTEYLDAVGNYAVAFEVAEKDARRLRDSRFTEEERKRLERAQHMLKVAVDESATPAERQTAYRRVREELDGLIDLSDAAVENLEKKVALQLGPAAASALGTASADRSTPAGGCAPPAAPPGPLVAPPRTLPQRLRPGSAPAHRALMRVGLIGAGGIAASHLDAWQAVGANCLIASRTRPAALAERFRVPIVDDVDELIDRVDVVGILAPTPTHPDLALRAIARGRHVVCEKPLAVSAPEAQRIADAAEAAGVRLFPAHVVRYFDAYRRMQQDIVTGALGRIRSLRLSRSGTAPTSPWFFDESAGGGLIRDLLIHDIDQALWLAGPVATVSAQQDPPSVDGRLAPPVTATLRLTHVDGAVTRIDGGWLGEGTPFRTTIEAAGAAGVRRHDSAAGSADPPGRTTCHRWLARDQPIARRSRISPTRSAPAFRLA